MLEAIHDIVVLGQTNADLLANLLDVHSQRLTKMDQNGIDFVRILPVPCTTFSIVTHRNDMQMVLSCASPCIQGISDPDIASAMAIEANNELARQISNNTLRFGAFAALSMHNATVAAQELKRAVTELGFLGGLVNDYQQSGADNG